MKAKKSLGQNFLIDQNVINNICDLVDAKEDDLIIEIGPGRGALTKLLKTKNVNIICYELDTDLFVYLNKLEDNKTKIIYNDILSADIYNDIKDIKYNNLYIVGNLPYYITTPIIKHIIDLGLNYYKLIFMVQEEVADRFTAKPGSKNYGSISLYLSYYFDLKKEFVVSKKCFKPVPKVESAIISLSVRTNKPSIDTEKYFKLVNDSFFMKRKTLKNNLKNYDFNKISDILIKYGLNDTVRAEELSEDIFLEILNVI